MRVLSLALFLAVVTISNAQLATFTKGFQNKVTTVLKTKTGPILEQVIIYVRDGKYKDLATDITKIIQDKALMEMIPLASVYSGCKSCFEKAGTTFSTFMEKKAGPVLTNKLVNAYLKNLDAKAKQHKANGVKDLIGKLSQNANAALTNNLMKAMMTSIKQKANKAEWQCTLDYLPKVLTGVATMLKNMGPKA